MKEFRCCGTCRFAKWKTVDGRITFRKGGDCTYPTKITSPKCEKIVIVRNPISFGQHKFCKLWEQDKPK